jgi:hypothetical protein
MFSVYPQCEIVNFVFSAVLNASSIEVFRMGFARQRFSSNQHRGQPVDRGRPIIENGFAVLARGRRRSEVTGSERVLIIMSYQDVRY